MNGQNNGTNPGGLADRIAAYDFALLDMNLFLDTHPQDKEGAALRDAYRTKRAELVEAYERRHGTYSPTACSVNGERWSWVDDPWPWDRM